MCADSKKSKVAKSPCVSSSDVLVVPEAVVREPATGEKEGEGEKEIEQGGGTRGVEREGNVVEGEGERPRLGEEAPATAEKGGGAMSDVVVLSAEDNTQLSSQNGDMTSTEGATELVDGPAETQDEGAAPVIRRDDDVVVGSPCNGREKLEQAVESCSPPALSPPVPCATRSGVTCEEGGGEEGMVVSSVMSEEDEGPLDSSMEDLPTFPHLPPDGEQCTVEPL